MASIYGLEVPNKNCIHEVAVPGNMEFKNLVDKRTQPDFEPAKDYPFQLDSFQERSILCIENDESVLVSAHTSAGKTVVAEYAIAKSLKKGQRCIYTTPIKALSNQKYREFDEKFQDVGLITGDVTIKPEASCLIMTTEILRQMLFRGNEIMREVGWVIFDEIHYMRDKERGVVWEETIILLPDNCHYVFLSATIPNARQFAEWISYIHHQPCHVVYTDYRPVPLEHHIFAGGKIYKVLDSDGKLLQDKFEIAMSHIESAKNDERDGERPPKRKNFHEAKENIACNLERVIKAAKSKSLVPIIIFSFSKKECELYATKLKNECFNDEQEKESVDLIFQQATSILSVEDRKLTEGFRNLLQNGVGIHHGGLLPIIKEVTEILFGEGLIKTLFATETFAMGLNMPAKTVVFSNVRKFDGKDFRYISSGEYIQMSGRAGRRGLDDRGIVILMVDEKITSAVGKNLLQGKPDSLNSAFHLTYNMVLNLLRVEGVDPDYMLKQSFYNFQNLARVPMIEQEISNLQNEQSNILIENETKVRDNARIQDTLNDLMKEYYATYQSSENITRFLNDRPVKIVSDDGIDLGWAMCLKHEKVPKKRKLNRGEELNEIVVDVLVSIDKKHFLATSSMKPPIENEESLPVIAQVGPRNIVSISSFKVKLQDDLRSPEAKQSVVKTLESIQKRTQGLFNPLDPIEDMGIQSDTFKTLLKKIAVYEKRLNDIGDIDSKSVELYKQKQAVAKIIDSKKLELRDAKNSVQLVELKNMKRVLRRLGYCSMNDVIEIKGRVACEITSGDELLLTEMLFNGAFNDITAHQANALLSCFVFDEKIDSSPKLIEELDQPLRMMQDLAKRIATVSREANLELDEGEYLDKFKPNLMDVVYAWSKGASFVEICKLSDAYVGSIVRCMRRLEELLRQMGQASKVIGNQDLENKFLDAITFIKRDIVFAASLYL